VNVYGPQATSQALEWWETAGFNVAADRPWRDEYQHAIEQIVGRLAACTTLDELVAAVYEDVIYGDAVRVAKLRDGRQLAAWAIHSAAFWQRWRELAG
jgi:hypothetical protein